MPAKPSKGEFQNSASQGNLQGCTTYISKTQKRPPTEMTDHPGVAAQTQCPPLRRHHHQCLDELDTRAAQQPASSQPRRGEVCSHGTQTTEQISALLLKSEGTWPCQMSSNTKTRPWGLASPLLSAPTQLSVHEKPALQKERLQSRTEICPGATRTLLLLSGCRSAVTLVQHTPEAMLEVRVVANVANTFRDVWFKSAGNGQVQQGRLLPGAASKHPAKNNPECAVPSEKDRKGYGNRRPRYCGLRSTARVCCFCFL